MSETLEILVDMEMRSFSSNSDDQKIALSDTNFLKKNGKLDIVFCNLYIDIFKVDPFQGFDSEELNKSTVLDRTPFIELNVENFRQNFGFGNLINVLELSWKVEEKAEPCALVQFNSEQAYLTFMLFIGRYNFPVSNRYFINDDKFQNLSSSRFYNRSHSISPSIWEKNRSAYKRLDISKMTAKEIYNYNRMRTPGLKQTSKPIAFP